jgi:hypothetical protein
MALEALTKRSQTYILENAISMEAQGDIDTLFNYANHMRNLTSDTKVILFKISCLPAHTREQSSII